MFLTIYRDTSIYVVWGFIIIHPEYWFFFSLFVTTIREKMNTWNQKWFTQQGIGLTPEEFSLYQYTVSPFCTVSSVGSIHNALITTLQNVILQKCNSVGRKKEQLLQSLVSKVLNYNEKSNNLIWSQQKSFILDIYPLLWCEGWSWSFKKTSLHLPPLPPYQTTKLFTNTCINWKRKLNQDHLFPFESWWSTKHNNMQ